MHFPASVFVERQYAGLSILKVDDLLSKVISFSGSISLTAIIIEPTLMLFSMDRESQHSCGSVKVHSVQSISFITRWEQTKKFQPVKTRGCSHIGALK